MTYFPSQSRPQCFHIHDSALFDLHLLFPTNRGEPHGRNDEGGDIKILSDVQSSTETRAIAIAKFKLQLQLQPQTSTSNIKLQLSLEEDG